jgi:hypothetical protein
MYILGLNINHADTAASIFKNNNLIDKVRDEDFFKIFPELNDLTNYAPT